MKFQFLTENFSRSENAPPFETRKIRHFEVKRIFLKNKKMLEDFLQSLFRKCGFSWFALLFCAPTFAKLRSCGASKFFCLQRGSGRLILLPQFNTCSSSGVFDRLLVKKSFDLLRLFLNASHMGFCMFFKLSIPFCRRSFGKGRFQIPVQ